MASAAARHATLASAPEPAGATMVIGGVLVLVACSWKRWTRRIRGGSKRRGKSY